MMQYMVAGMMFGQGNYLAHYGRKGMKWGKNIFGDEVTGEYGGRGKNVSAGYKYTINGSSRARAKVQRETERLRRENQAAGQQARGGYAYQKHQREMVKNVTADLHKANLIRANEARRRMAEQEAYRNSLAGKIEFGTRKYYNQAKKGAINAYNSASAAVNKYGNQAIDAVSNRDEYARLQEAIQKGADPETLRMLQEQYDSHWMTRAQKGVQSGMNFVTNLFSKISGSVKDAAGKAVSYAKSTWNQVKEKAAPYVNAAKRWLERVWSYAKGTARNIGRRVQQEVTIARARYANYQKQKAKQRGSQAIKNMPSAWA